MYIICACDLLLIILLVTIGTSWPAFIISVAFLLISLSDLTASLNKSPVLRCVNPYLATILSHWVPFPHPGPPENLYIYYLYSRYILY